MTKSIDKGKAGEREVCAALKPIYPDVARDLDQVRGHGNGRDLVATEPFCIQVKRYKAVTPGLIESAYLEAALSIDMRYRLAVAIHRADRQPWRVTISLADLMTYLLPTLVVGATSICGPVRLEMSLDDFVKICAKKEGSTHAQN